VYNQRAMQQVTVQEQVDYASVGWRFAAVLVDMAVLFGIFLVAIMVWAFVLVAQGRVDPNDPASAQALAQDLVGSDWVFNAIFFGALFVYYTVLESIFGASVGKLAFRMRVVMLDGSRPTGVAIVVRNLIRLPEAWLLYIPSGISCLASSRRQRLGDHAARTTVVRRRSSAGAPGAGRQAQAPPAAGPPPAPPAAGQPTAPAPVAGWAAPSAPSASAPSLEDVLGALKTAALAARGAHLNYLRFSERELAASAGAAPGDYSDEYVSAWFTLADAVASLRQARAAATAAAAAAGTTLDLACASRPDLAHLLGELTPYATATTDEEIHAAFLAVARAEAPGS
jgi:uncharacterized RDD family membrane protein YckC